MLSNRVRYALFAGIAAANAYRAHRLSQFAAGLTVPPPLLTTVEAQRFGICTAAVTRPGGEVVNCLLDAGHDGQFHQGRADGVPKYTWPTQPARRASDAPPPAVTCACDCTLLLSDISQQKADEWVWRIYDVGCDHNERLFAVGTSDTLDEAREDVVSTMQELSANSGFQMSRPEHAVSHHIAATLQQP